MIRNGNEIGLNINRHCNKINYESSYLSEKLIFFRECSLNVQLLLCAVSKNLYYCVLRGYIELTVFWQSLNLPERARGSSFACAASALHCFVIEDCRTYYVKCKKFNCYICTLIKIRLMVQQQQQLVLQHTARLLAVCRLPPPFEEN